jgi:transposase
MPRQSPFSVALSEDERQHLESITRQYTSPYCDVIRAKIVLLASQGLSNEVIASRLDTPRQIVSKWRKRFCLARLPGLEDEPRGGRQARFPPSLVVQVKALACELPHRQGLPLSRFSIADIRQEVLAQGLVAQISGATVWRWLSQDAIRPWRYRSWIFPTRSIVSGKGGSHPRSLPGCLARTTSWPPGFCTFRRRKAEHSSATSQAPFASSRPGPSSAHRARVRAQGSLGLPRRLGRPTRQNLRSLRAPERDPTL